jgi:hypothetical protein
MTRRTTRTPWLFLGRENGEVGLRRAPLVSAFQFGWPSSPPGGSGWPERERNVGNARAGGFGTVNSSARGCGRKRAPATRDRSSALSAD